VDKLVLNSPVMGWDGERNEPRVCHQELRECGATKRTGSRPGDEGMTPSYSGGEAYPLEGMRVLDLSRHLPGAYATKLLVDAGADVVKVEPEGGDPLRSWTLSHVDLHGEDGGLFHYLCTSKRSVVGRPSDAEEWAENADVVVEDLPTGQIDIEKIRGSWPGLVVVSITPFGRAGPWADRTATEFTLQGWCGSIGGRGEPGRIPIQAGGRLGEWVTGVFAATAAVAAWRQARLHGRGDHVDVSMLESMIRVTKPFGLLNKGIGAPTNQLYYQVPGIMPTADGQIGVCLMTRQNYSDFVSLIGHPELDTDELARAEVRFQRRDELLPLAFAWTAARSSDEVAEIFTSVGIVVAPIGNGDNLPYLEQCRATGTFVTNPSGGFPQPRVPYRLSGAPTRPLGPAPDLPRESGPPTWVEPRSKQSSAAPEAVAELPLAGIRVIDFTMWWAGPEATDLLAGLGADVIKVESIRRPDMFRTLTARPGDERWWEYSMGFHVSNRNKRGITLDVQDPDGLALTWRLIRTADVVIENFKPQVFEGLGLTWEAIHQAAPRAVFVRMPGFGLSGPWRDRGAYAPTIEMVTGHASTTGFSPTEPIAPSGPADPNAGLHAAFATLVAIEARDRTGVGMFVEAPMFEAGVSVAAEAVIETSVYGNLLRPAGNRTQHATPQGVFECRGAQRWVALAVEDDEQWVQFAVVTGLDEVVSGGAGYRERLVAEERIEAHLAEWCHSKDRDEIVRLLAERGVPVAPVLFTTEVDTIPQLWSRHFLQRVEHPLTGSELHPTHPFRFASWGAISSIRTAAPTLGQHTEEVLAELGVGPHELKRLSERGVIGTALVTG
jgi:crotonobetainyl-CoA:carnitine CoA-transferase CaiB-like acyl-CoA transferase